MDGMEDLTTVGRNARRIRQERRLSLGQVAKDAGVAKQTLANVENGTGNPTVQTLLAIARALGVGVNWLVAEWGSPVLVQRHANARWDQAPAGRHRSLDQIYGSGQVTTAVLELARSHRKPDPPLPPGTLLHAYVISGSVVAGPANDPRALDAGDFIRFPADVPYLLHAESHAVVHLVTTIPQVQQYYAEATVEGLEA